jgi:hypothetical protein
MNIGKIKQTRSGYFVNDSMSVPNAPDNFDYQYVQKYIANGGIVEPEFTNAELLANAKSAKKKEIKQLRTKELSVDLLAKVIDGKSYYVKIDPEINLFSSAILMENNSTRLWGCYVDGKKELIKLTKSDLLGIAHHYEERKSQQYNLCDLRRQKVDSLSSLEEVEAFDINKVYKI